MTTQQTIINGSNLAFVHLRLISDHDYSKVLHARETT